MRVREPGAIQVHSFSVVPRSVSFLSLREASVFLVIASALARRSVLKTVLWAIGYSENRWMVFKHAYTLKIHWIASSLLLLAMTGLLRVFLCFLIKPRRLKGVLVFLVIASAWARRDPSTLFFRHARSVGFSCHCERRQFFLSLRLR